MVDECAPLIFPLLSVCRQAEERAAEQAAQAAQQAEQAQRAPMPGAWMVGYMHLETQRAFVWTPVEFQFAVGCV